MKSRIRRTEQDKDGNLGAFMDRLLPGRHLGNKTWDGTGLFGFWPATVNALVGTLVGNLLQSNPILFSSCGYSPAALKLWSTVLVSFGATVTFWSCSPSFS